MNRIYLVIFILVLGQVNKAEAQFTFGLKTGMVLSQVDGDNLVGFKKVGYDAGILGGYQLNFNHNFIVELSYSRLGSNRLSETVPNNKDKSLFEVDLHTANAFLGYAYGFGDNWDGVNLYRFTGGLKFSRVLGSDVTIYNKSRITQEEKSISANYITLRIGPGFLLRDNLYFDFFYEHALSNLSKNSDKTVITSLTPFTLNFILSYYL